MKLKFKSKFLPYLIGFPTSKMSGEVTNGSKMSRERALDSPDIGLSNAHRIMTIRQVEVTYIYYIYIFFILVREYIYSNNAVHFGQYNYADHLVSTHIRYVTSKA